MPRHFFVGKKVEGRDFCVKLIDATTATDDVVASGAVSSMTLDVVVLDSDFGKEDHHDWTWEHFECKLEPSREGKGPLLEGDLQVRLKGGVGSLGEFKFTDISTCRRSGKLRLGVKVASGFYQDIRLLEAITAPFEVIHFKKKSKEKHVTRALDDDVCTLMGIGKNGALHKNLNNAGIFEVKDFLWKLGLDPKGLRKIVGKTMSEKKWKTLGDHAKESIPCGEYHVYYADDTKNSCVVYKKMSELCGLIEDGKYYSAETLSDNKKLLVNTLKRKACDNWKQIDEYDDSMLVMNQSAAPSEQDFMLPEPATGVLDIGAYVLCSNSSWEASKNSMPDYEGADLIYGPMLHFDSVSLPDPGPMELGVLSLDALSGEADENRVFSVGGYGDYFEQWKGLGGSNWPCNGVRPTFRPGSAWSDDAVYPCSSLPELASSDDYEYRRERGDARPCFLSDDYEYRRERGAAIPCSGSSVKPCALARPCSLSDIDKYRRERSAAIPCSGSSVKPLARMMRQPSPEMAYLNSELKRLSLG